MTQEEYEAKVQSMPKELQSQFRQSLELNLSKRIVNRFMSTVMQAYAHGQRTAQKVSHDSAYMRGAEDMLEALKFVFDMVPADIDKYFGYRHISHWDAVYDVLHKTSACVIMETVKKRLEVAKDEEDERQKAVVQAMADTIGIEKLCQIADEIRKQKADDWDCLLPF